MLDAGSMWKSRLQLEAKSLELVGCVSVCMAHGQTTLIHAEWAVNEPQNTYSLAVSQNTCYFLAEKLPPTPGECTFEQDECAFTQERRNRSSWHRRRGETPTSYTGPKGDHTTGVGELRHTVLFPKEN